VLVVGATVVCSLVSQVSYAVLLVMFVSLMGGWSYSLLLVSFFSNKTKNFCSNTIRNIW